MKDKMILSCLIIKQNSFKPLKQSRFTLQQKRFKCFRQFEKMHLEKIVKQKEETVSTENRSSHQRCFMKKGVLKNFTKFTGKHLCQNTFY